MQNPQNFSHQKFFHTPVVPQLGDMEQLQLSRISILFQNLGMGIYRGHLTYPINCSSMKT